jgi:hypothetical protein
MELYPEDIHRYDLYSISASIVKDVVLAGFCKP